MAIRRLINMIQAVDRNVKAARADSQVNPPVDNKASATAFVEIGTVQSAQQTKATVTFRGETVIAGLATDEPLVADQRVYVLQTDNKSLVVLGSVK